MLQGLYAISNCLKAGKTSIDGAVHQFFSEELPPGISSPFVLVNKCHDGTKLYDLHIDNIVFSLSTALKAVDMLFKSCTIMNLKYPKKATSIFTFIQQYFFKIVYSTDYKSSNLIALRQELEDEST